MKIRLSVFVIFFALLLASCYSAGDVTPPPSYEFPTLEIIPGTATATTVPAVPTATPEPPTPTMETTPNLTEQATPSVEVSVTPASTAVSISGLVTNASGSPLAGDLSAVLYLYNTNSSQVDHTLTSAIGTDGTYQFIEVPVDSAVTYLVVVTYAGVNYFSSPAPYDAATSAYDLPVTVYDATTDLTELTLDQYHVQFDFSTDGQIQVQALYVVSNPGTKSVLITSDGSSIPFIMIPEGATDVQYSLANGSAPLMTTDAGFAMLPGSGNQYGIFALFTFPYTRSLKLTQTFTLPVVSATVIVPEGVRVSSKQLTDSGVQASNGTNFQLYEASDLTADSSLTLTISGKPGDSTGFTFNQQAIVMIGIALIGLILVGLGLFLFLRDRGRARRQTEEDDEAEQEDNEKAGVSEDERDHILDTIIALDEQYKGGEISKESYDQRRAELKERLKE